MAEQQSAVLAGHRGRAQALALKAVHRRLLAGGRVVDDGRAVIDGQQPVVSQPVLLQKDLTFDFGFYAGVDVKSGTVTV